MYDSLCFSSVAAVCETRGLLAKQSNKRQLKLRLEDGKFKVVKF